MVPVLEPRSPDPHVLSEVLHKYVYTFITTEGACLKAHICHNPFWRCRESKQNLSASLPVINYYSLPSELLIVFLSGLTGGSLVIWLQAKEQHIARRRQKRNMPCEMSKFTEKKMAVLHILKGGG